MLRLDYLEYDEKIKKSAVESIYDDISKNIIDGFLFSGYKITEQQLASKYNISRTPIREVLRKLETNGLIEITKNKGASVTGFSKNSYMDLLLERKSLETLCLSLAMDRIKEQEMKLLVENNNFIQFYYSAEDTDALAKIYKGFHFILYYSIYNKRLTDRLKFYYQCSDRKDALHSFYEKYNNDLYIYYSAIFTCFRDKNKEKALALMEKIMDLFIAFQYNNLY